MTTGKRPVQRAVAAAGVLGLATAAVGLAVTAALATHFKAPPEARALRNPIRATPASLRRGQELYRLNCAKCHGLTGLGDGPSVGSLRTHGGLNLTILGSETDGEIFWKISVGRGEMPPWELVLKPEDRWHLVNYLRTLKPPR
ncbi:MAG: c-type cytochrome [Armatimonadota bacterium]|nr:c-type cytochrome [Armatimonadota bacterium]